MEITVSIKADNERTKYARWDDERRPGRMLANQWRNIVMRIAYSTVSPKNNVLTC